MRVGTSKLGITYVSFLVAIFFLTNPVLAEKSELYYDDSVADFWQGMGGTYGHVVLFSPPSSPYTLTKVRFLAFASSQSIAKDYNVQIWDKDLNVLYDKNHPYSAFSKQPKWVSINLPDISVKGDFYVAVFTSSTQDALYIALDNSSINTNSKIFTKSKMEEKDWTLVDFSKDKQKISKWMIRASGYSPEEVAPPKIPIATGDKEVELKYDDGTADRVYSMGEFFHVVSFPPPEVPWIINKVKIYGRIVGTATGKEFRI